MKRKEMLHDVAEWLVEPRDTGSVWGVVKWWEARRLPFNFFFAAYAIPCFAIYAIAVSTSGILSPGDDLIEPMLLFAAPFLVNLLYTLGWLVEVPATLLAPTRTARLGPALLKAGLGLGCVLATLPAAFWFGYRAFQIAGLLPPGHFAGQP